MKKDSRKKITNGIIFIIVAVYAAGFRVSP